MGQRTSVLQPRLSETLETRKVRFDRHKDDGILRVLGVYVLKVPTSEKICFPSRCLKEPIRKKIKTEDHSVDSVTGMSRIPGDQTNSGRY